MPVDAITPLGRLPALAPQSQVQQAAAPAGGFAAVLNQALAGSTDAANGADRAIASLATGEAQDLAQVSLAVAQADLAFRLVLELRNRLADTFQEVTRMQL